MPDLDTTLAIEDSEEKSTRRDFFVQAGLAACAVAGVGSAVVTLDFMKPKVLFEPPTTFVAGSPLDYSEGVVRFNKEKKAFVIGAPNGVYAISAVCTHLGCIARSKSDEKVIACPCHGGQFNPSTGAVTAGPPPAPLPPVSVVVEKKQIFLVSS